MSVHPSFKSGKNKQQKSVLKRLARILVLKKEDKWHEDKDSVFGLPKVKVVKMKIKKEKKEAAEGEAASAAAPGAAQTAPAKAADSKAKEPAAKGKDKK
ncbi:MAG: small basic protein [Candidatus Omnitrophica bacterium]|nr:small basic protein [Candidatus Omnitrophota bacterium]